jgi:undecaprenyl-diphosphatase
MNILTTLIQWDKALLVTLNGCHSPWMDWFMWLCSQTLIWIPFFFVFLVLLIKNKKSGSILILLSLALLILFTDQIASGVFKPLIHRLRPTHDPEISNLVHCVKDYKGGSYGFFSSHAANMFAFAGFSLILIRNTYYSISVLVWASLVAYSRIYLGVHFPLDIVTGIVFGLISAGLFYKLYRFIENGKTRRTSAALKNRKKIKPVYSEKEVLLLLLVLATTLITCLTAAKMML